MERAMLAEVYSGTTAVGCDSGSAPGAEVGRVRSKERAP